MLFKKKEFSMDLETGLIIDESVIDCYGGGKGGVTYQPPEPQPIVSPTPPIEEASVELDEEEKLAFLSELGVEESGLNRLIRVGYKLLGLITYFTAGVQEVRAWTIKAGTNAQKSAGEIHTDIEKGFIRAEVVAFDEFIKNSGWNGAKDKGVMRLEGKEYIVKDGDVMYFRFNV